MIEEFSRKKTLVKSREFLDKKTLAWSRENDKMSIDGSMRICLRREKNDSSDRNGDSVQVSRRTDE